jgi:hypothetical protein
LVPINFASTRLRQRCRRCRSKRLQINSSCSILRQPAQKLIHLQASDGERESNDWVFSGSMHTASTQPFNRLLNRKRRTPTARKTHTGLQAAEALRLCIGRTWSPAISRGKGRPSIAHRKEITSPPGIDARQMSAAPK